jgi:hypothetical protein
MVMVLYRKIRQMLLGLSPTNVIRMRVDENTLFLEEGTHLSHAPLQDLARSAALLGPSRKDGLLHMAITFCKRFCGHARRLRRLNTILESIHSPKPAQSGCNSALTAHNARTEPLPSMGGRYPTEIEFTFT